MKNILNKFRKIIPLGYSLVGCLLCTFVANAGVPTDTYFIYNRNSGLNLAPSTGGTANGTALVQGTFVSSTNTTQEWNVTDLGNGQFKIVGVASGRAATVGSGATTNNAPIQLWDYAAATDQKVTMTSRTSGFFSLVFVNSGKAMNVYGGSTASSAVIVQYDNDGAWNSQWRMHSVSSRIVPKAGSNWMSIYLAHQNATKSLARNLIFDGDSITQFWTSTGSSVWNANFVPKGVYDFGISGDRTEHLDWRVLEGQSDATNPKLVVLLIGTNNISSDDAATIASKITTIVNDYLSHCPNSHILLLGILPRGQAANTPLRNLIIDINNQISSLNGAGGGRVTYLDIGSKFLQSDGTISTSIMADYLHPTAAGYQIFANAILPTVNKYVP